MIVTNAAPCAFEAEGQSMRCEATCGVHAVSAAGVSRKVESPALQRQAQRGFAAAALAAVFEGEAAPVGFGNLTAKHQADAGTAPFGGKEWHKQIGGVGQAWTVVFHQDFKIGRGGQPADPNARWYRRASSCGNFRG